MPTFVHTADIHFDTPFSARFSPKQAEIRRKEVMQTFRRIVAEAGEKDLLLISGDLFDGKFVSGETVAFLKRCFAAIPNTKVLIAAGNHDPLTNESVYLTEDLGSNVRVFGTEIEYVDFPDIKTRVHGISFKGSREDTALLDELKIHEDWCNILVLHGEVVANGGVSDYNPIEKAKIENSGAEYLALGHIHKHSGIERLGKTVYAYPGIPEGRGFDEEDERGFIVGEIEKGSVNAAWQNISCRNFIICEVDVSESEDSLRILELAAEKLEKGGADNIYRIILTGKVNQKLVNIDLLNEQLKDKAFYIEVQDKTMPDYAIEDIAKEKGLKGEFVSSMLKMIEDMPDGEKEIGCMALNLGIEAMERGQNL